MVLEGKRVLVTGGTGSMGKTFVRRVLRGELGTPRKLIVLSRDEGKQHDMRVDYLHRHRPATDDIVYRNFMNVLEFRIGDVRSYNDLISAMRDADIVVHAAALKQVPTCEYFPGQAIMTNCLGAMNIVQVIQDHRLPIETVIAISTDKACKPVNAMGMTKALQERVIIAANILNTSTRFICVRYGNVLASRGSVIPLFHDQIRSGGPVTITDARMTRFLLTLDDAVETTFEALRSARPGEIYIPAAPGARITDIAKALIGDRSIGIRETGVRPGEKFDEILVSEEEVNHTIRRGDYYVVRPALPELSNDYGPLERALNKEFSSGDFVLDYPETVDLMSRNGLMLESVAQEAGELLQMTGFKVVTLVGTRPELIKLSLTIAELDRAVSHILVHTGQNHDFELNEVFFRDLAIRKPDHFLDAAAATPAATIARVIERFDEVLEREKPDAMLLLGDTNSCLGVIVAKRRKIPVFHMEAGNRCFDDRVPEEINRRIVDHTSDINLPYTEHARRYLIAEGFAPDRIIKTGSPMTEILAHFRSRIDASTALADHGLTRQGYFVVSAHREENVDRADRLRALLTALNDAADGNNLPVLFSTHPRTRQRLDALGSIKVSPRIRFVKPLGFFEYVRLQMDARCVISDSGTLTEESALLNFPAVMIREAHERPEGMDEGTVVMTSLNSDSLMRAIDLVCRQAQFPRRLPPDYVSDDVSHKVVRIILSYTDFVNRKVWSKGSTDGAT